MGELFDPYHKWLGIPPEEQPPDYYRLLGVKTFETDPDVIQATADQRMAHLRTYQTGQYAEWSQRLLNEVAVARICLLNPAKKPAYDQQLRETMRPKLPTAQPLELEPELDFSVAVVADEPNPHTSHAPPHKTRVPVGAIIAGMTALSVVLVGGLVYLSVDSQEKPLVASNQSGHPEDRHDEAAAEVEKPQADRGMGKEKKPDGKPIPNRSGKNNPPRSVVQPPSASTTDTSDSSKKPSQAKLHLKPDAEQPEVAEGNVSGKAKEGKSESPSDFNKKKIAGRDSASGRSSDSKQDKQPESKKPDRIAVPAAAAQDEAMKLARDLYKDDFAKAKTAEEKQSLAKKLLSQAEDAASADAGTFVLLRLARDISIQASNGEMAFEAIDAMSERYLVDAVEMKAETLSAYAKKARTPPQHLSVAEQASRLLDEATAARNYVQAVNLAKLAVSEGSLARNKEFVLWAKACLQDLQKKAKLVTESEAARSTLITVPDDPAANQTVGLYDGYIRDDWKKALPCLAKGTDQDLQSLAKRELASPPTSTDAQLALADAWWDAGQNAEGVKRLAMLHHAGSWYAKAQTEELSGLSKIKVEKRLEEVAKTEHESAAGPAPRVSVPLGKWFPLLTSPNELTGWEVTDCRFNYVNRIIDLQGREMYCPIVAKDVSIRAKVKRQNASTIRLILRNSDKGCYVAQLMGNRWSIVKVRRNPQPGADRAPAWMRQRGEEDTLKSIHGGRNFGSQPFGMGFAAAGNTLTVFLNGQPLLQAQDLAFTEGTVGIGTDGASGLFVTDIELLIPNKGSLIGDRRTMAGSGSGKASNANRPPARGPSDNPFGDSVDNEGLDGGGVHGDNLLDPPGKNPPKKHK